MDFSNSAFQPNTLKPKVSTDTMSHANLVVACQWGWSRFPESNTDDAQGPFPTMPAPRSVPGSTPNNVRTKRFAPCQGRLYHQLLCSHRIRTDLVEDCGTNCVEPFTSTIDSTFICNECAQAEATEIWETRKAQHDGTYPPTTQMSKEQYIKYYDEHRQLQAEFEHDRRNYELELRSRMRPSNICSAQEASQEDQEFAAELDSLSLSLMASNTTANNQRQPQMQGRGRSSIPSDASEQLHWNLNALALDRGSCGIEYMASPPATNVSQRQCTDKEELWNKPRS